MRDLRSRFANGRKALIAFITAGDPSFDRTVEIAVALELAGVDVLELGVPFSDPLADGPVIQRASERALRAGATLSGVLDCARRIRERSGLPIVLFSYLNPLLRYGLERLARDARGAGVDGVLVTDLPPEEAAEWLSIARAAQLDTVFLAAPTSPDERLRRIADASRGFVYAISRTGVTGEREALSSDAAPLVARVKSLTSEPVALGFGISTPEQVRAAAAVADGVVVGSALVRFLEEHPDGELRAFVTPLRGALESSRKVEFGEC
jgi:tryptophan synthase alpha chain